MLLHIIQQSPNESSALTRCLDVADEKDGILLIENGVYAVNHIISTSERYQRILKHGQLYALKSDLSLRGITENNNATVITYDEFVNLYTHYSKSFTWV